MNSSLVGVSITLTDLGLFNSFEVFLYKGFNFTDYCLGLTLWFSYFFTKTGAFFYG